MDQNVFEWLLCLEMKFRRVLVAATILITLAILGNMFIPYAKSSHEKLSETDVAETDVAETEVTKTEVTKTEHTSKPYNPDVDLALLRTVSFDKVS